MLFLLTLLPYIISSNDFDHFSGEPCLELKGIYSPVNILNNNIHAIVDALDPFRANSSIEILDLLFDQGL